MGKMDYYKNYYIAKPVFPIVFNRFFANVVIFNEGYRYIFLFLRIMIKKY